MGTFNSQFSEKLINKRILKENVIESFKLTYINFMKALENRDVEKINKLTTAKFQSYFKENFLNEYISNKQIKMTLENANNYSLAVENLKNYTVIYGLDLANYSQSSEQKYGELNLIPGTFLKKILFYNKTIWKTKFFVPPILVVDVIFNSNLKPLLQTPKEFLFKSSSDSTESYVWQFICFHKFKTYDVPFVVNERTIKNFLNLSEISNKEDLNLISFFENRQKEYENYGWKINDINNFVRSNYKFIVF